MSIISTLEQEEPILVTAKELRRIVAIEMIEIIMNF